MIFGRFLIDFWLIFLRCCSFFDQMFMDFRSSFCSCSVHVLLCCWCFGLLACCFVGLLTHRTSTKEHTNSPNFHKRIAKKLGELAGTFAKKLGELAGTFAKG